VKRLKGSEEKHRINPLAVAAVSAAGITALAVLPRGHGVIKVIGTVFEIVLAGVAAAATYMGQHQAEQSQRLSLSISSKELTFSTLPRFDPLIESWLDDLKSQCLESLEEYEERRRQPGLRLAESLVSSLGLQTPEQRTAGEYRRQVNSFLVDVEASARKRLLQEYVATSFGRIQLVMTNLTERTFDRVRIEIKLPPDARAYFEPLDEGDMETLPTPPREYGVPTDHSKFLISEIAGLSLHSTYLKAPIILEPFTVSYHSDHALVSLGEKNLRPTASTLLPEFCVVLDRAPGSEIKITWEATASNAIGRLKGDISFQVTAAPAESDNLGIRFHAFLYEK
jgi:hypothetical protein